MKSHARHTSSDNRPVDGEPAVEKDATPTGLLPARASLVSCSPMDVSTPQKTTEQTGTGPCKPAIDVSQATPDSGAPTSSDARMRHSADDVTPSGLLTVKGTVTPQEKVHVAVGNEADPGSLRKDSSQSDSPAPKIDQRITEDSSIGGKINSDEQQAQVASTPTRPTADPLPSGSPKRAHGLKIAQDKSIVKPPNPGVLEQLSGQACEQSNGTEGVNLHRMFAGVPSPSANPNYWPLPAAVRPPSLADTPSSLSYGGMRTPSRHFPRSRAFNPGENPTFRTSGRSGYAEPYHQFPVRNWHPHHLDPGQSASKIDVPGISAALEQNIYRPTTVQLYTYPGQRHGYRNLNEQSRVHECTNRAASQIGSRQNTNESSSHGYPHMYQNWVSPSTVTQGARSDPFWFHQNDPNSRHMLSPPGHQGGSRNVQNQFTQLTSGHTANGTARGYPGPPNKVGNSDLNDVQSSTNKRLNAGYLTPPPVKRGRIGCIGPAGVNTDVRLSQSERAARVARREAWKSPHVAPGSDSRPLISPAIVLRAHLAGERSDHRASALEAGCNAAQELFKTPVVRSASAINTVNVTGATIGKSTNDAGEKEVDGEKPSKSQVRSTLKCPNPGCVRRFHDEVTMSLHFQGLHSGLEGNQCGVCGARHETTVDLEYHVWEVHERNSSRGKEFRLSCPKCSAIFDSVDSQKWHIAHMHGGAVLQRRASGQHGRENLRSG